MKKETRTVVYDDELRIEAYRFEGIVQPFPNHFHEYYVIGFIEDGERCLSCKGQEYVTTKEMCIRDRSCLPCGYLRRERDDDTLRRSHQIRQYQHGLLAVSFLRFRAFELIFAKGV